MEESDIGRSYLGIQGDYASEIPLSIRWARGEEINKRRKKGGGKERKERKEEGKKKRERRERSSREEHEQEVEIYAENFNLIQEKYIGRLVNSTGLSPGTHNIGRDTLEETHTD